MSTERKQLELNVSFGSYSGGGNEDNGGFTLVLNDKTSGLRVAKVELTFKQVGELLASRGVTAPAEVFVSENHGRTREVMQLRVDVSHDLWPASSQRDDETAIEGFAKLRKVAYGLALRDAGYGSEWVADDDKTYNHHRSGKDGYLVTFTRYVDPEVTV